MKRSAFGRLKDAGLEKALLLLLGPKLERYGEIHRLKLDTAARRVSAEILLLGESEPVRIEEARYRVERRDKENYLVVHSVRISRPWVQHLLEDHLPEISVKIPDGVRVLIE
jgi:hypothetical protein